MWCCVLGKMRVRVLLWALLSWARRVGVPCRATARGVCAGFRVVDLVKCGATEARASGRACQCRWNFVLCAQALCVWSGTQRLQQVSDVRKNLEDEGEEHARDVRSVLVVHAWGVLLMHGMEG